MEQSANSMSGIRWKEKFSYGMGEVASGVTFGLVQAVLEQQKAKEEKFGKSV